MSGLKLLNKTLIIVSMLGISVSLYAYQVEQKLEEDDNYSAMCDINEQIKCTKVLSSEYAKGFGLIGKYFGEDSILNQPNSVAGILFYIICILLSCSDGIKITKNLFMLTLMSNFMSIYLGYILYYVLEDFCIVCVTIYAVNLTLTLVSFTKLKTVQHLDKKVS